MKLTGKYVFKICTVLLTLIAAGLAAEAAGLLSTSGFLHIYSERLWDTSWLISNESGGGKILKITLGYDSTPRGIQIAFYILSIGITISLMKLRSISSRKNHA